MLITIFGFIVLKIITLASTGLFVEDLTEFPGQRTSLTRVTKFDGSLWNVTQPFGSQDASIAYTAYGVLARNVVVQGQGATDEIAYESLDLPYELVSRMKRVEAQLDAFIPSFNCQNASVAINPTPYGSDGEQSTDSIAIMSPECRLMGGAQPIFVMDASSEICPKTQFRGNMVRVNCSTTAEDQTVWQLLTLAKVSYEQVLNDSATDSTLAVDISRTDIVLSRVEIEQVASLLCRPSYTMGMVNVSYDFSQAPAQVTAGNPFLNNASLEGLKDEDLASRFTSSLVAGANMFGDLSAQSDQAEDFPSTLFKIMAASISSGGRYQSLMDGHMMRIAAEKTFQQFAVRFATNNLLEEDTSKLNGTAALFANRLKVAALPFWVMVGGFALMVIIALVALLLRPQSELPAWHHTIYGTALLLHQNPGFSNVIESVCGLHETELARKLSDYGFSAFSSHDVDSTSRFVVNAFPRGDACVSSGVPPRASPPGGDEGVWWHPIPMRKPVVSLILLLLLSAIAVLEVLQRQSDNHQGILTLSETDTTATAAYTRLLPSLVVLILATSVNAIDFNIMVLAPFNALKSRDVTAKGSLTNSLLDKLPPVGLFEAIRHRHFAAFCSSTAAIIGSVLTVLVSALYTSKVVSGVVDQLNLAAKDTFNTSGPRSAIDDGTAALIVSLIETLDADYPAFTYDELALPMLPPQPSSIFDNMTEVLFQTTYPALRASLNCTTLDTRSFNVSVVYDPRIETTSATIDANVPLPPNCLLGGPGGNLSFIEVTYRAGFQANSSYFAKVLDLHVGPYDAIQGSAFGESDPGAQADNPPGCPSLAFVYGYADFDQPAKNDVTMLMCYQEIQTVETSVMFELGSMLISSQAPVLTESSVKLLHSGPDGETAFSYRIQQHMDQSLSMFNQTQFASANLAEAPVDNFFQAVLFGRKPLPITSLVGKNNRAVIFEGINAFYRRYMAQVMSSTMRVPVKAADANAQSYTGTVYSLSQRVRLVQDSRAKLALQISFGVMAVLTALACYLTKSDGLVPYNPCTIFGVASLLAGSRMCSNGRFEAREKGGDQVKYRLRWWDGNQDAAETSGTEGYQAIKRRYGIDIDAGCS